MSAVRSGESGSAADGPIRSRMTRWRATCVLSHQAAEHESNPQNSGHAPVSRSKRAGRKFSKLPISSTRWRAQCIANGHHADIRGAGFRGRKAVDRFQNAEAENLLADDRCMHVALGDINALGLLGP
jgi:hypothetical protein